VVYDEGQFKVWKYVMNYSCSAKYPITRSTSKHFENFLDLYSIILCSLHDWFITYPC